MPVPTVTERITGKNVVVDTFNTLGHLFLERTSDAAAVYASNTQGGADREDGNIRLRGYIWAWGHTPPTFPNSQFALNFTTNTSSGDRCACAAVMCTGLELFVPTYDPQKRNRIYYVVHFGTAGYDLTTGGGGAAYTSSASTLAFPVKSLATTLNGTAESGTEMMHLQIRQDGEETVDSSLNGIYFTPQGNIDWTFRYRRAINSPNLLPALNSLWTVGMQVTGGTTPTTWALAYGKVQQKHEIYDRQSGKVVAADVVINKCMSGANVGSIVNPAGATLWPS